MFEIAVCEDCGEIALVGKQEFGKLAQGGNTMIVPANVTDLASIVAVGQKVLSASKKIEG